MWAVLAVVGAGVVLTAVQVIVTQIIRLRASARITSSRDAVRVLEIEDLRRGQCGTSRPGHLREVPRAELVQRWTGPGRPVRQIRSGR
jgi:hypothetical protein